MRRVLETLVILLVSFPGITVAYEPTTTHAGLSQEIVEFYNLNYSRKLTEQEKELVIRGSMEEDSPPYRALNHFFDPVHNIGFNDGHNAKEWAFSTTLQKYDVLAGKGEQDYSWPRALEDYVRGDEERAFLALGHIVHLLEDMSVPDHTRNDPHKGDAVTHSSPYETWTNLNKNRSTIRGLAATHFMDGDKPSELPSGRALFDFVSNYSNKNFFSLDTISNGTFKYNEPRVVELDDNYGYGIDNLLGDKHKIIKVKRDDDGTNLVILDHKDDHSILIDYFDRLARQDIRAGAGLIHLFLEEAEAARKEYQLRVLEEQRKTEESAQAAMAREERFGFMGRVANAVLAKLLEPVGEGIARTTTGAGSGLTVLYYRTTQNIANISRVLGFTGKQVAVSQAKSLAVQTSKIPNSQALGPAYFVIARPVRSQASQASTKTTNQTVQKLEFGSLASNLPAGEAGSGPEARLQVFGPTPTQVKPVSDVEHLEALPISGGSEAASTTSQSSVLGTPPSALLGIFSTSTITLVANPTNQYQPGFGGGSTPVVIVVETSPSVPEPLLSTPLPPPPADITPPDITLTLTQCAHSLATDGCLLATTTVAVAWSSSASDLAYYTFSYHNGTATTSATTTVTSRTLSIQDKSIYQIEVAAYDKNGNGATTTLRRVETNLRPLVVNEVAWAGSAASPIDEWIELKNLTAHPLALSEMVLEAVDGTPSIALSGTLAVSSFYLLERRDDSAVSNMSADLVYGNGTSPWALQNDGDELRLLHIVGSATTVLDSTPEIADCDGWCAGEGNPTFRSMQRKENGDYDSYLADTSDALDRNGATLFGTPRAENNFDFDPPPLE